MSLLNKILATLENSPLCGACFLHSVFPGSLTFSGANEHVCLSSNVNFCVLNCSQNVVITWAIVLFVTSHVATMIFIHCLNMRYPKLDSRTYLTWRKSSTVFLFYHVAAAPLGQGLLIVEDSWSHSYTPYSVGLLWTIDQPDAETSTWQHTTLTRDRHRSPRWDLNPQSQQTSGHRPTPYTAWPLGFVAQLLGHSKNYISIQLK